MAMRERIAEPEVRIHSPPADRPSLSGLRLRSRFRFRHIGQRKRNAGVERLAKLLPVACSRPAFIRWLIFSRSNLASEARTARRTLRTSSFSVDKETTEIFIEMVFEILLGRISEKTGRRGCQQAHMLASTRRRPIVVARRWRIIRRSIRSIIRRGCVVGWPGGPPPRCCQTGRAGRQFGKRG